MQPNIVCLDPETALQFDGNDFVCVRLEQQYGGFYTTNGGAVCKYKNPYTNACTCPTGYTITPFWSWRAWGGLTASYMYQCKRTP
jgi:hypothetical protein